MMAPERAKSQRVFLSGDHSQYHGGSAAVISAIRRMLPDVTFAETGGPFDTLIVNGEGSMHHDSAHFVAKMEQLAAAQMLGKKTCLVNAVWQENSGRFDDVLRNLDVLTLRGPASAADMFERHGVAAFHHADLSLFAPIEPREPVVDFGGATVVTDFFNKDFGGFVRSTSGPFSKLPYFNLADYDWSDAIATLATAGAVLTGRHHVMFAAVRARVPFILMDANTHKLADLLDAASAKLPVCKTQSEAVIALNRIKTNRIIYDRLFDWAEKQTPPKLLTQTPPQQPASVLPVHERLKDARLHLQFNRPRIAMDVIADLLEEGGVVPDAQLIAVSQASGEGWRAAQLVADRIVSSVSPLRWLSSIGRFGADAAGWDRLIPDSKAPIWWQSAVELFRNLKSPEVLVNEEQILNVLSLTNTAVEYEAARLAMEERASKLWRMDVAGILNKHVHKEELPMAYVEHVSAIFPARFHLFGDAEMNAAREQLVNPELVCQIRISYLVEYLRRSSSDKKQLLRDATSALDRVVGARHLLQVRVAAVALAVEDNEAAAKALSKAAIPQSIIQQCLVVSNFANKLVSPALAGLAGVDATDLGFSRRVGTQKNRIAVVGNGPLSSDISPDEIDDHDLIIRINDFLLGEAWGNNVDYHVTVLTGMIGFGQANLSRVRFGTLIRKADLPFQLTNWKPTAQILEFGHKVGFLPRLSRASLQKRIGTEVSTGLAILSEIAHLRQSMAGVSVFGMPLLCGDTDRRRVQSSVSHSRHFWESEALEFKRLRAK
jgi:Polysaccharide pyruvyl transferase